MSVEVIAEVKDPNKGSVSKETKFPFPMRAKHDGKVVLFFEEKKGTLISGGESTSYILSNSHTYISCYDSGHWEKVENGAEYSIKLTFKGYDR